MGVAGDPILKPKNEKPLEIQVLAILVVSPLANFAYGMTIVRACSVVTSLVRFI